MWRCGRGVEREIGRLRGRGCRVEGSRRGWCLVVRSEAELVAWQVTWGAYVDEAEAACAGAGIDRECSGVKKFLNRILGMKIDLQNKIFTHFMACLEHQVKVAKEVRGRTHRSRVQLLEEI